MHVKNKSPLEDGYYQVFYLHFKPQMSHLFNLWPPFFVYSQIPLCLIIELKIPKFVTKIKLCEDRGELGDPSLEWASD